MTPPSEPEQPANASARYQSELVRGAWVNAIGLGAKLVQPLFILVVTWLFGPAVMGVFFLGTFILDLVLGASVSGFADATTILGSRHADSDTRDELYGTLGTALRWATLTSVALALALAGGAVPLVQALYPDYPELAGVLRLLAVAVPFMAWSQLGIAATKARMRMEYDAAIMGFLNPIARLLFAVLAWAMGGGLTAFIVGIVAAEVVTFAAALVAYRRHFEVRATIRRALGAGRDGELVRFALPQSLNMTFSRYLTRIDVLMLAAFGFGKTQVAFYATAALITANLRQVRLVFSSSLAPIAARHHHAEEQGQLEAVLNRVSRWTGTLIVPLVLTLVVFRADILRFVDEAYVGDTTFMVALLVSPLVGCALGLVGNCLIYTGHTGWTLANSFIVALLNTAFNALLIPRWGLMGAALGTAGAAVVIASLQMVQLRRLERISLRWRPLWTPAAGFVVAVLALAWIWDPAELALWARVSWGLALPVGYLALLGALGHPEIRSIVRRRAAPGGTRG